MLNVKASLDERVLAYLKDYERCSGATQWAIANGIMEPEGNVAAALRRLRERGKVRYDKTTRAWVAT